MTNQKQKDKRNLTYKDGFYILFFVILFFIIIMAFILGCTSAKEKLKKEYYKEQMINFCMMSNEQTELLKITFPALERELKQDLENINVSADYIFDSFPDLDELKFDCSEYLLE